MCQQERLRGDGQLGELDDLSGGEEGLVRELEATRARVLGADLVQVQIARLGQLGLHHAEPAKRPIFFKISFEVLKLFGKDAAAPKNKIITQVVCFKKRRDSGRGLLAEVCLLHADLRVLNFKSLEMK